MSQDARSAATFHDRLREHKHSLRGCAWVVLSFSFLGLFRGGILGTWTAFITVGVLVLANEYLLIWIEKTFQTKDAAYVPPTVQETWSVTRTQGKRRFLLVNIAIYGVSVLLLTIFGKVILLESFPLYLVPIFVLAGALWGYLEGVGEWQRNERQHRKLRETSHDAA